MGVVFFTPSDLRVRTLMQDGFERLLAEPNRSRFIEASNGGLGVTFAVYLPRA